MARLTPSTAQPATTNMPTRTTRSQSREVEPQPAQRRPGRATRGSTVESDNTARRSRFSKQAPLTDLATVNEEGQSNVPPPSHQEPIGNVIVGLDIDDDYGDGDADGRSHGRTSAVSGISGTTAKTSFSDDEIRDMDADVMLDSLPSLNTASDNLLDCLIPRTATGESVPWTVWKDITTDGTKAQKLFKARTKAFDVFKTNYGSSDYIQPDRVLRALFEVSSVEEVPENASRPDPIIRKANLAMLLSALLITGRDPLDVSGDSYDALEAAQAFFPTSLASDDFRDNDFEMACAISTQLAIRRIAACMKDPNHDPQGIATAVFYEESDDGSWKFKYQDSLHMEALNEEDLQYHLSIVEATVDELKQPFGQDVDSEIAVNRLRAKHPWDEFIKDLVAYYKETKRSFNQQIKAAGGVESIIDNVRNDLNGNAELAIAREIEADLKRSTGTPRSTFDKSSISRLKALTEASGQQPAISQGQAPTAQMVPSQGYEVRMPVDSSAPSFFESDDAPVAKRKILPTKTGKPSLLDRQPGATRVSWDVDSQVSGYQTQPQASESTDHQGNVDPDLGSHTPGKRPHVENEDADFGWDPSQDGPFETAHYDPASADDRRRRTAAMQTQSPRPAATMRPGAESNAINTDIHGRMTSASASPSKRQRKNPGSAVLVPTPNMPSTSGEENPSTAWQRAKIDSNHVRVIAAQRRPPRERRRWTEAEENCILTLIGDCEEGSITWTLLKAHEEANDNILNGRTAEDIRFKARNMKVTMLRARQQPWGGWDKVLLSKKEIDNLEGLGIAYEQPMMRRRAGGTNDE